MDLNDDLVNKLAMLSRLHFNSTEKLEIKADLGKMISFIDKLNELDTSGVKPCLHITENINVLRDDELLQDTTRESALFNSPVKDSEFFKVPKVIRK